MFFVLLLIYGERTDTDITAGVPHRVDPRFHSTEQRQKLSAVVVLWRHVVYYRIASCNIDEAWQSKGRTGADVKKDKEMFLLRRTYRAGS